MGMAASQARLLTITARMHDIEYQAQELQNNKIQLSTQSDQVYQDYLKALDATTLTVMKMDPAGNQSPVAATFNNLCSKDKLQTANNKTYALFDKRGRLIVEKGIVESYKNFKKSDYSHLGAEGFAMYMLGFETGKKDGKTYGYEDIEVAAFDSLESKSNRLTTENEAVLAILQEAVDLVGSGEEIKDFHQSTVLYTPISDPDKQHEMDKIKVRYENALESLRYALYQEHAEEVFKEACKGTGNPGLSEKDFNYSLMQYYISLYNQIEAAGGCVSISSFEDPLLKQHERDEDASNVANNTEWLQAMIQSGVITIDIVNANSKNGKVTFGATSPSSDEAISYTETTSIDKTALAKAEAKYEHDMKSIDKKDKEYDMSLSKLEAERSALKTQYDSLTKVINANVERTFSIFSS